MAEAGRRKLYDQLAADKMRMQGFHFPFPAVGYIEKDGNGYRYTPAPVESGRLDLRIAKATKGRLRAALFIGARPA